MQPLAKLLSADERDAVADLVTHEGWSAFMKLVEGLVAEQEHEVIKLTIKDGVDQVIHAKLRAEGARKLRHSIERLKGHFKG